MARHISVKEAEANLSELLERVEGGEEISIDRGSVPAARLVPVSSRASRDRELGGSWEGKVWVAPDFDAPDEALERLVYDGSVFSGSERPPDAG
ncbi:MAG TPA: type II toxin-antitoxin system prevent-host-death family antitoxin [Polyangia bacterium]|nr:type II toxin-antitoxin system prevent-host-death family antitoxin [Polyangia bacterium]